MYGSNDLKFNLMSCSGNDLAEFSPGASPVRLLIAANWSDIQNVLQRNRGKND